MTDEKTQPGSLPVRFELIDKDGNTYGPYASAYHAGMVAKAAWPDEEQDEDRTGRRLGHPGRSLAAS